MDLFKIIEDHRNGRQISFENAWILIEQYVIDRTGSKPTKVDINMGIPKHQQQINHAFGVAVDYFFNNRINLGLAVDRLKKS